MPKSRGRKPKKNRAPATAAPKKRLDNLNNMFRRLNNNGEAIEKRHECLFAGGLGCGPSFESVP